MTTFFLSYKLRKTEDTSIIHKVMKAWQSWQVQKSTWILKRNDNCTC